jgi:hypothetical protein
MADAFFDFGTLNCSSLGMNRTLLPKERILEICKWKLKKAATSIKDDDEFSLWCEQQLNLMSYFGWENVWGSAENAVLGEPDNV